MTVSSKQILPNKAQAISPGMSTRGPGSSSDLKVDKVKYDVVSVM
jgi:hypothetical protein